jgi:DNA-binding response OmpR family regulator
MGPFDPADSRLVLLIDDEPGVHGFVRLCLGTLNLEIEVAVDAQSGLHLAATRPYRAILLDLALSGANGLEMLDSLRLSSRAPIVVVTGVGTREIEAEAIRRGASAVVHKPFTIATLVAVLCDVMRGSRG